MKEKSLVEKVRLRAIEKRKELESDPNTIEQSFTSMKIAEKFLRHPKGFAVSQPIMSLAVLKFLGYSEEEITAMVSNLLLCKDKIQELKLSYASTNVQNIQKKINELGSTFSIDKLKELYELNNQISNLSRDDKEILDLTLYNLLKESYDEYRNQVKIEGNEAEQIANNVFKVAVITALTTTVAVALAVVISKKYI